MTYFILWLFLNLFPQFKILIAVERSRRPVNKQRNENLNSFSSNRIFLNKKLHLPYVFQIASFSNRDPKSCRTIQICKSQWNAVSYVCVCVCVYNKRVAFIRQNQLRKLYQIFAKSLKFGVIAYILEEHILLYSAIGFKIWKKSFK